MRRDLRLQLEGGDVLAAPADHVLQAVDEEEPAAIVDPEGVAGMEPAVAGGADRRRGVAMIAAEQRPGPARERKSVGTGKRGAVRIGLGGCRTSQKKNNKEK